MKEKVLSVVGLIGFLLVVGLLGGWESKYTRDAVCTGYVNGIYTFTDVSGNDWEWEEEEGDSFQLGESYTLKIDDNHSTSIYDDWIYKIK